MASRIESPVRLLYRDPGVVVGEVAGSLAVVIWRDSVTCARFEQQASAVASVVQRAPGACGFLCVIEPNAPPPDDALRRASVAMVEGHGSQLARIACVIEGDGFRAAVTRSVLSGMRLLLGSRAAKASFFSSVHESILWLQGSLRLGTSTSAVAAVEQLRSRMSAPD